MSIRHTTSALPEPLRALALSGDRLRISGPDIPAADFEMVVARTLSARVADEIVRGERGAAVLVSYERSSPEARATLRRANLSYVGSDGRIYLRAPGLYVDRGEALPGQRPATEWGEDDGAGVRNPFAPRGSRVARWLLLHHRKPLSVSEIARAVDVSAPATSRLVRALEDRAFLAAVESDDGRRRVVTLARPGALLREWAPRWERRRIRQQWWDIGARDAGEALAVLSDATKGEERAGWAIGGLAGAAHWRRAVEPAHVLVWTDEDQLAALRHRLDPVPGRAGRGGTLRMALTPDPWVLSLAEAGGVPVADPVQVWLDCATEGERALEAADGVAAVLGW